MELDDVDTVVGCTTQLRKKDNNPANPTAIAYFTFPKYHYTKYP